MRQTQKRTISAILLALLMLNLLCGCGQRVSDNGNTGGLNLDYVGEEDSSPTETEEEDRPWYSVITDAFNFGGGSRSDTSDDTSSDTGAGTGTTTSTPNSVQEVYEQGTADYEAAQGGTTSQQPSGGQTQQTPSGNTPAPDHNTDDSTSGHTDSTQTPQDTGDNTTNQGTQDSGQTQTPPTSANTVTMTIRCDTAVANGMHLESKWAGIVPASGVILDTTTFEIEDGDTVLDVLLQARDQYKLHVEYSGTQSGAYVEGINNLYEFDGGRWSGWMYCVNDWYPNYGCGVYYLKAGDVIEWNYTCDLGLDLDAGMEGAQDWKDTHE